MKGIGRGVREFNDAKTHVKDQLEEGMKEKDREVVAQQEIQQNQQVPTQPVAPTQQSIPTGQVSRP